jgi:hypothetical protein
LHLLTSQVTQLKVDSTSVNEEYNESNPSELRDVLRSMTKLVDKVCSVPSGSGMRGADVRTLIKMPSLDPIRVSPADRLADVREWVLDLRSTFKAMFPTKQLGEKFWTWWQKSAAAIHEEYIDLSPDRKVAFVFDFTAPSEFIEVSDKVTLLLKEASCKEVRVLCHHWRVRSPESESPLGVLFLALLCAFGGTSDERKALSRALVLPSGVVKPEHMSAVLREFTNRIKAVKNFLNVQPDYGVMIKELTKFIKPLD